MAPVALSTGALSAIRPGSGVSPDLRRRIAQIPKHAALAWLLARPLVSSLAKTSDAPCVAGCTWLYAYPQGPRWTSRHRRVARLIFQRPDFSARCALRTVWAAGPSGPCHHGFQLRKFVISRRPSCWLFSGWNWVPAMLSRPTRAVTGPPWSVSATTSERRAAFRWKEWTK
jgi:hypothetical protein